MNKEPNEKEKINETETDEKNKDVFSTDKLEDIISDARKNVMYHWNDYNSNDMLRYLASKISMIRKHLPNTYRLIQKRQNDPETTLHTNDAMMDERKYFEWWELIEGTGEEVDQHGYYKFRGMGEQIIIQETPMVYNWNVVFGLCDMLYEKGRVNVCIGNMGSGKSSMMLGMGLKSIQLGYYILSSNLGVKEGYEHKWIKRCVWMTELLRILCHNKIENIKYIKQGNPLKSMTVNITLDEGEAIMSSTSRKDDKQAGIFLKFIQFCRKLDASISFIYHDMDNFPSSMRKSSNINAIIYKGMDKENNKLNDEKKEAIIDFPSRNYTVHIDDIQGCDLLDTDEWGSFDIIDDDQPDKSVTMNEIFKITKDKRSYDVPHAILRYLDDLSFENQPYDNVLEMVRKREMQIRESYIYQIEKPKEYETILKREMEQAYKISDISKIRFSEKAIKKVAQEEYDIFQVEQRKKELDPASIDYKKCDFDLLITFVTKNKTHKLKKIVGEDYREINNIEIRELLNKGVSKQRIMSVYSYRVRNIDIFKDIEATLLKD